MYYGFYVVLGCLGGMVAAYYYQKQQQQQYSSTTATSSFSENKNPFAAVSGGLGNLVTRGGHRLGTAPTDNTATAPSYNFSSKSSGGDLIRRRRPDWLPWNKQGGDALSDRDKSRQARLARFANPSTTSSDTNDSSREPKTD
jgi:hypothetical protein